MNEKLNKYINYLPEGLKQKARDCKTTDEIMELIADNDIELPDEILTIVSGGEGSCNENRVLRERGSLLEYDCPRCQNRLKYWDQNFIDGVRGYCDNPVCKGFKTKKLFAIRGFSIDKGPNNWVDELKDETWG